MKVEEAIEIVLSLASDNALTDNQVAEDAEVLAPMQTSQNEAIATVQDFFVNVVFESRLEPTSEEDDMKNRLNSLVWEFRTKADDADTAFISTTDPRALQGGAVCEIANTYREIAKSLRDLTKKLD